ncbi:uncharacterized protein LOC123664624 [Melitaea cinxia]|uniref:uncharacterized protein LOC123664624 n=1 Tax=Melitaea cinxia TaxID=113334 RepID=UPI001E273A24|nr:uncharacterized protein LOC123664624 [Melitaea cinxia]
MESFINDERIEPLPGGERRGTFGADAGRDSMQTVSGSLLSRRARAGGPEDTTADQRGREGTDDVLQSRASPTNSAGSSASTTNKAVSDDRRRKWSTEELEELMCCYFKARSGGAGYINRLEELFAARNPENPKILKFYGNTLANQARRVIKQNVISQELLNRIQKRAEGIVTTENIDHFSTPSHIEHTHIQSEESGITQIQTLRDPPSNNTQPTPTERAEEIDQLTRNIVVDENQEPIVLQFLQTLAEIKDIPIEERLFLPKAKINKSFIENLNTLNKYLPNLLVTNNSLREINDILYATAKTLIVNNNQNPYAPTIAIKPKRDPPWKKRIQIRIEKLRKELGQLIEIERGINTNRMRKIRDKLYTKHNIRSENDHKNTAEIIKQRIKALAGRIKRYEEMNTKKEQNKLFAENEHKLYRSLGSNTAKDIKIPSKENVEEFWKSILSNPQPYNAEANWIKKIETMSNEVNTVDSVEITEDQVRFALRRMHNWKSPGLDQIQNYYIKYLTNVHKYLASLFTNIVSGTEPVEEWFTTGKVILVPKNENTEDPKNWRPIACLPSMYKLLTSVLANVLYNHCHKNNIISEEQRGCRRGVRGCKDHLMVNKAILEDAHQSQKNLSMAWIDYRKAFDSVSHEWLLKLLDVYRCPPVIKRFLILAMPSWRVISEPRAVKPVARTSQ